MNSKNQKKDDLDTKFVLQQIIDLMPVGIFWKDKELKYLGFNKIFAKDSGMNNPVKILGADDYEMAWKKYAEEYRNDDMEVINTGKPKLDYMELFSTPAGETISVRTNKIPIKNVEGKVIGVLGIYDQMIDRKTVEDRIQALSDEIEKYQEVLVDREMKMVELKQELKKLKD